MPEVQYGAVDGVNADNIDFFAELNMTDLMDAIAQSGALGADIMIIGKKIGSGKKTREIGANWGHFGDTEEIFNYLKGEYDPDDVEYSKEIFQDLFHLPEPPEKIVGFIIRPTEGG